MVQITGGDRVGLTVTDPPLQVVPAGRSQQVKIPAEVTRSGQFQVTAQLIGDDGQPWGPPVQLAVESTAYGALTVIIIVVAGGVLVLMVVLRIVQRLRGQGDGPAVGLPAKGPLPQSGVGAEQRPAERSSEPVDRETGHSALRQVVVAPPTPADRRTPAPSARNDSGRPGQPDQVRTDRP
jgi:hypothetical protein